MKKSLLALAVLGTFAGVASAQSSVTLFGIVDLSANSVKNDPAVGASTSTKLLASNQLNSNRLGFRGVEDLGGGLSAGFWLEAAMDNSNGVLGGGNGQAAPAAGSSIFSRRSTVSLIGRFGEIRAGRDYTPTFWNTAVFDAFGANGLPNGTNIISSSLGTAAITFVRDNNTVGYFLPGNLGGLYGQAQIAAPQGQVGQKYQGGRIGYAAGPFNVAVAVGQTELGANDFKASNVGASWNFGFATILGYYNQHKVGSTKQTMWNLSATIPFGQNEIRLTYGDADMEGPATNPAGLRNADDATAMGIGYSYNLSKRTALYGTYGQVKNDGASAFRVSAGGLGSAAGGKSTGYNVGIRHSF
jgi:predicted porin